VKNWAEFFKNMTDGESFTFEYIRSGYNAAQSYTTDKFSIFCRLFLADDPEAELAKMVMAHSASFDDFPEFETVEEYDDWHTKRSSEWNHKMQEEQDRDLLAVQTFLAKIQEPPSSHEE
jgi:hypothetical protein